jgi:hypothetical protein
MRILLRSTANCRSIVEIFLTEEESDSDAQPSGRGRVRCPKENLRRGFEPYVLAGIAKWTFSRGDCGKKGPQTKINHPATTYARSASALDADCSPFTVSRSDWWIYATSHALTPRWRSENLTLRARRFPPHPLRPNRFPCDFRSAPGPRHSV